MDLRTIAEVIVIGTRRPGYAAILLGSVRCDISNVRYSSYSILIAAVVRFQK